MTNPIPPALSAEEWKDKEAQIEGYDGGSLPLAIRNGGLELNYEYWIAPSASPQVIALANASLPDDDPRKITRHHVWIIRTLAGHVDRQHPSGINFGMEALDLADALESLLPPEKD